MKKLLITAALAGAATIAATTAIADGRQPAQPVLFQVERPLNKIGIFSGSLKQEQVVGLTIERDLIDPRFAIVGSGWQTLSAKTSLPGVTNYQDGIDLALKYKPFAFTPSALNGLYGEAGLHRTTYHMQSPIGPNLPLMLGFTDTRFGGLVGVGYQRTLFKNVEGDISYRLYSNTQFMQQPGNQMFKMGLKYAFN